MKLRNFHVKMFKGVIDSREVEVDPLTVLVGKNESGKTTLLKALHKLNPATPEPYLLDREWPRGRRKERSKEQVACMASFALDEEEVAALSKLTDQKVDIKTVEVTRDYGGRLEVLFPNELFPKQLHPNEVDRHCETLPPVPEGIGATFRDVATKAREDARRLAREGRFTQLAVLHTQQTPPLQAALSPADQPEHPIEQQHLEQHTSAVRQVAQKLQTLPTIQTQAHDYVVGRLPKFIYMTDYRIFQGKALLNQVKERKDAKRSNEDDETFLMILNLSGLDLDDLVARGGSDDREQRQYDVEDGARTLTATFRQRLKQREYTVEFRADGQEFYTMVKDQTDVGLIRLDERSKGFQWFFSFDLLFMHESAGTFENCVLLLDEPGLHLHPGAQKDLLGRLEEYAKGNTLIYSTHLPFMLDLRHPERIRVISDSENGAVVTADLTQSQPEERLTLQAALGISGSQSYLVAQRNVVVEGAHDYMILTELSNLFARSGEEALPEDVHVTAAGGASEAAYIATFMIGQQLDVAVLLDSDQAGEEARDQLVKKWLTRYKGKETQVLSLGAVVGASGREFAIEDLFPDDFYVERVKAAYKKELAAAGLHEIKLVGKGQVCQRVERALADAGIKFNKGSVAKRIRGDITRMKETAELPQETKDSVTKLFSRIRQALPT